MNTIIEHIAMNDKSIDGTSQHVDATQVHETLGRHLLADGFGFVLDLDNSKGSYIIDGRTGKRYLDFFTFFASHPIGYNHPKMNTPEFIAKIGRIALHKPSCSDVYTVEMAEFVETFFRVAIPDYFKYCFFIEGGAMAIENALKTAFDWKVRKNFAKGYTEERGQLVAHFKHAFHGRSGYTMSLTNTDPIKTLHYPKFTNWPRIESPEAKFPLTDANLEQTIESEQRAIAALEQAFIEHKDDIACVIIEPIQSEGGDKHFRSEFLTALRDCCDRHEALLIFDEIQTGVGLSGTMWVHEQLGVRPDIMAFGKKSQVCGIVVSDRIDDIPDHVFKTSGRINSTWGGNLTDMVRFTKFLEIIDEEQLIENAWEVGAYLLEQLLLIQSEFPTMISNTRGRGLLCAFDFPDTKTRDTFRNSCYEHALLILGCGDHTIRFRPPLNLSRSEVDEGMSIIRTVLQQLS